MKADENKSTTRVWKYGCPCPIMKRHARHLSIAGSMKLQIALIGALTSTGAFGAGLYTETFSSEPTYWSGSGNHDPLLPRPQDYGWRNSDFTGTGVTPIDSPASGAGEMGGLMSRNDGATYYAADIGSLSL